MLWEPQEQLTQEKGDWGVPILKAGSTYQLYALLCETQEDGWTKWVLTNWGRDIVCLRQPGTGQAQRSGREKRRQAHGTLPGLTLRA